MNFNWRKLYTYRYFIYTFLLSRLQRRVRYCRDVANMVFHRDPTIRQVKVSKMFSWHKKLGKWFPSWLISFNWVSKNHQGETKFFHLNVASIHPSLHPSIHIAPHQSLVMQNPRSGPPPATVEAMRTIFFFALVKHFLGKIRVVWVLTKRCSRWKNEMCIFNSPGEKISNHLWCKKLGDPSKMEYWGRFTGWWFLSGFISFSNTPKGIKALFFSTRIEIRLKPVGGVKCQDVK